MKKILLLGILFLFCFTKNSLAIVCNTWEQAPTDKLEVTIKNVKLYNSSTSEWVTVIENDEQFDFASVAANTVIDQYGSPVSDFGVGNYTKAKIKLSLSAIVKHHFIDDSGWGYPDRYTAADYSSSTQMVTNDTGPAADGTLDMIENPFGMDVPAGSVYTLGADYVEWEIDISFEKTASTTQKMVIKFDISESVGLDCGGSLWVNLPIPYITFE